MRIEPTAERVLIQPKEPEQRTAGGIYIPDTAQEKTREGKVIAIGKTEKPTAVMIGDMVIYETFGGTEITIDGKKHLIMNVKDVIAIIK